MPATNPTDAAPKGKGLAVLVLDRRTKEWRRRGEMVAMLMDQLGGSVSEGLQRQINATAEMLVIAEIARARFLAGEAGISLDDVIRAERTAGLAEKRLSQHMRKSSSSRRSLADIIKDAA